MNIDNDDNDDFFDIDDKDVSGGDNELAPIKAYFRLLGGDYPTVAADGTANKGNIVPDNITLLFRAIGLAPQTVRLWQKASKEIPYDNAFELSYKKNDFTKETIGSIDWLTANVWAEGIVAHTAPNQAQFELLVKDEDVSADGNCNRGNVALTVCEVKSIEWIGVGNGEVNSPTYTSNELKCDAITGCRVFPDGRYANNAVSASKDIVNIKITLSTDMPDNFTLYVKSFDADDPSQNKVDIGVTNRPAGILILDPNDDGIDGTYEGGQSLTYTKENDNRATLKTGEIIAKTGVNSRLVDDVFMVTFLKNIPFVEKIEFKVSQFAGDNYQLYAFCDNSYLPTLKNLDNLDDSKIANVTLGGKRMECKGAKSEVLTVWRLLHTEIDGMTNFINDENQISTVFTDFKIDVNGDIEEIKGLINTLRDESLDADSSPPSQGRFENGSIIFNTNNTFNDIIKENGEKRIVLKKSLSIQKLPFYLDNGSKITVSISNVQKINATTFKWFLNTNIPNLANFNGAKFRAIEDVIINQMNVIDTDVNGKFIVTDFCKIPIIVRDDDQLNILPYGSTQIGQKINILKSSMSDCYILPILDGGGTITNENSNAKFAKNIWTKSNMPEFLNSGLLSLNGIIWKSIKDNIQSSSVENDNFWAIHLFGAFQGNQSNDKDPGAEGTAYGITDTYAIQLNSTIIAKGGQTSVMCREAFYDPDKNIRGEDWTIAHEIGHQFGLTHGYVNSVEIPEANEFCHFMGLLAPPGIIIKTQAGTQYTLDSSNNYIPRYQNLIRSRLKSPGL